MTRKLEEVFDLPPSNNNSDTLELPVTTSTLAEIDNTIDKIEAALPMVRGLEASDDEMDDLAGKAVNSYQELMDLGMQVDSRFASEIFSVASNMLGHAITAKTAKMNKKLKMIDLQLKKLKLDTANNKNAEDTVPTEQGQLLDRNDLLKRIIGDRSQKSN